MRDLDLTSLRLFVSVCETGNIARAGDKANIVGSAISKRLAQLEDTVGTPLLVRKRHGVAPTAAGHTLLEHARAMLDSAARIERDMEAYAAGARGQVRILASRFRHGRIAGRRRRRVPADAGAPRHPGRPGRARQPGDRARRSRGRGFAGRVLGRSRSGPAAVTRLPQRPSLHRRAAKHPLAHRKSLRFAETLDYEHVSLPVNSAVQVMLQRAAAQLGRKLNQRVVVSNFEAALRVVRAGLAISLVPLEVAEIYAQAYGLTIVPLTEPWAERRFIICFRDAQALSPAAQLLVDHLASRSHP